MYSEGVMTLLKPPPSLVSPQQSYLVPVSNTKSPPTPTWTFVWARKLGAAAQLYTKTATNTRTTRTSTILPAFPCPPPVLSVDDGAQPPNYVPVGNWTREPDSSAFGQQYHWSSGTANTATWNFSNVPPGWYKIAATWLPVSHCRPEELPDLAHRRHVHDIRRHGPRLGSIVAMDQSRSPGIEGSRGFTA